MFLFFLFFQGGFVYTCVCVCVLFLCCRATESAEVNMSGISARQHRDQQCHPGRQLTGVEVSPYFSGKNLTTLFSCRLLTTPIFQCRLSSVLSKFSQKKNYFRSGVTPSWRVSPGAVRPLSVVL